MSEEFDATDPLEAVDVRNFDIPDEPPFIADDLIHEAATIIYGRPEAGKSYYALSAAAAIQAGQPWLCKPTRQRNVFMMGLDPGQNRQTRRRIDLIPGDVSFQISQRRPIDSDAWWNATANYLERENVGLFIVDNLSRLVRGSINKNEDVEPALRRLDGIIDRDIAVVLIHHQGKPGEDGMPKSSPLGATCIEAWGRQFIQVDRVRGTRKADLTIYGNDVEPYTITTVHVPEGNGEHGAFFTVAKEKSVTTVTRIERDVTRLDTADTVAHHVLNSGETFTGMYGVAKWLVGNCPEGVAPKKFDAWKNWLRRSVFEGGKLAGGNGDIVVPGPNLTQHLKAA